MDDDQLFPSKYLRGSDLQGRAVTVAIDHVKMEKFFDQELKAEVEKPVIYFVGKQKGLIMGKSLAFQIAEICASKNTDDWKGREIMIYTERRLVFGQEKDVIKARGRG